MHQWYLSFDGRQVGPLTQAEAMAQAAREPNGHCWRQGFAEWIPIASCTELRAESAPGQIAVPPPPTAGTQRSDQIDYRIIGGDMQFVEVELDPGESAVAEAGTLMYKDSPWPAAACLTSWSAPASDWSPARACSPRSSPMAAPARPRLHSPRPTPAPSCR